MARHRSRDSVDREGSLGAGVRADLGRAIAMAAGGALAFAPVEYALTVWAYAGTSSPASKLRLAALVATLALVLAFALAVVLATVMIGARLVRARVDPAAGASPGWFVPAPVVDGVRPGVPLLWAAVGTAIALGLAVQRCAAWAIVHYKEPQLTAAL